MWKENLPSETFKKTLAMSGAKRAIWVFIASAGLQAGIPEGEVLDEMSSSLLDDFPTATETSRRSFAKRRISDALEVIEFMEASGLKIVKS